MFAEDNDGADDPPGDTTTSSEARTRSHQG